MPRVAHFEIPADDTAKAVAFYQDAFGWEFTQWGEYEYFLAMTGDEREPGINGAITKPDAIHQTVVNTVNVADLDGAEKSIIRNGGTILMPKSAVPTVGWMFYFRDPFGNVMGVMQPDPNAK